MKTCKLCLVEKPLDDYHVLNKSPDGRQPRCKSCACEIARKWQKDNRDHCNKKSREWARKNADKHHATNLKRNYGITGEQYNQMLAEQYYACALCGKSETETRRKRLSVDHDHTTGKVRGLLCSPCNKGIGHFKDSPTLLRKAALYLDKSGE